MKKFFAAILAASFLAGCANSRLTHEGKMVRQIQPDWAAKCAFLGAIEGSKGSGFSSAANQRGALIQIRNSVANIGGNAFVIVHSNSSGFSAYIQADAYKCP